MKKLITLNLYTKSRLEKRYKEIPAIYQNESYLFKIEGVKTSINEERFIRETAEYQFKLDIKKKTATYLLKEKNVLFDIEVEQLKYKENQKKIILEYKLSSDEENKKIEIIIEGELNE